mmetsp:Transcript_11390/g.33972  ORF Transcript_11390/g.33972 Transcript_11390/m.33972 type:complete len:157 (-) Transcript_11390:28-498(-)
MLKLLLVAIQCLKTARAARPTARRRPIALHPARAAAAAFAFAGCVAAPRAADAGVVDQLAAASRAADITYSQNGKNLQRMGQGDYTMGTKFTSTEPRALKRRATQACKSPKVLAQSDFADEKSCTMAVLDGAVDRVIVALDELGDKCLVDATHVCM